MADDDLVKLYMIPRGSIVVVRGRDGVDTELLFHRIDGMYSICMRASMNLEEMVPLSASTPLRRLPDGRYMVEMSDE